MGRAEYINDDDIVINLADFKNSSNNQRKIIKFFSFAPFDSNLYNFFFLSITYSIFFPRHTIFDTAGGTPMCFLGLEHVNKTQRRSRFNYLEKAIKIYN